MQNLLRGEPLKLVDGGQSQRTFVYIKDAIEAVLLMIVSPHILSFTLTCFSNIGHVIVVEVHLKQLLLLVGPLNAVIC